MDGSSATHGQTVTFTIGGETVTYTYDDGATAGTSGQEGWTTSDSFTDFDVTYDGNDVAITAKTTGASVNQPTVTVGGTAGTTDFDATPTWTAGTDASSGTGDASGTGTGDANTSVDTTKNGGINLLTQGNASAAIDLCRDAINTVSTERAKLGAIQNRLEHKITNLDNTVENVSAAESRIRDVDIAKEMTTFTKNNILSQASTAMLAQANSLPQGVLSLLQ